jgi:hypothetical protein
MEAQLHSDDMVRQFSILPENEGENYHKPEGQGKEIARKWSELRYTAGIANLYQLLQYILLEVKKTFSKHLQSDVCFAGMLAGWSVANM